MEDIYINREDIFGEYDVIYTQTGPKQVGEPAGGRFRGRLGRLLFTTTKVQQNLYKV